MLLSAACVVVDQLHEFHGSLGAVQVDGGAGTLTPFDRLLRVAAPIRESGSEPLGSSDFRGLTRVLIGVEAAEHREPDVRLVPLLLYADDPFAPFSDDP